MSGTHRRRRATLIATAGAVLGLAAARWTMPLLPYRACPDQLPGFAAAVGFDPLGGALRLAWGVLLSLAGGAAGWRFARPRCEARLGRAPAWPLLPRRFLETKAPSRKRVLVPAVAAHALSAWIFLIVPFGSGGARSRILLGILLVASFALAAALGGGDPEKGAGCLGAAAAILPFALLGPRPAALWLAVGAAAYLLPVFARLLAWLRPDAARLSRALVVAVLLPGSVTALAAAAMMRAPRVANVFEDGHALLPASEYMRGELPYRDIVPGHGLLSDGGLAFGSLRLFGDDYVGLKRGEKAAGAAFWPAVYALGWGATGSPGVAFGGLLLSFLMSVQYHNPRAIASLWVLALALQASRTRRPAAWVACGFALPIALCVAVEFAAYAAGGVAVALWVARGDRSKHLRRFGVGAAISGGLIALALGLLGVLPGFLGTTFRFIPALLPVYALGFSRIAVPMTAEALRAALLDPATLYFGFVALSVVLLGAWLARAPVVGPRGRAVLPICAWAVLAMLSDLERRHPYGFVVVPLGLLLVARWLRGWRGWASPRAWAPAAALACVAGLRQPVFLLALVGNAIEFTEPARGTVALSEPPRARGGLFVPTDAALVAATAEMMRRAGFRGGDTWFDFASMPGLYYLFDRDCPIRYYEVGFYETETAQREVIAAVAANPRIRAVLVSTAMGSIDGVTNAARAPLVAAFVADHFRPFYRDGVAEFWLRKP